MAAILCVRVKSDLDPEHLINSRRQTGNPRMTGDMKIFRQTRLFVQERKRGGYKK